MTGDAWYYLALGVALGWACAVLARYALRSRPRGANVARLGGLWEARCVYCLQAFRHPDLDTAVDWSAWHDQEAHR
jgi:hypothetical protein